MAGISSLIAGVTVAVVGVMLGKKLERLRADKNAHHSDPANATQAEPAPMTIDAKADPDTGTFKHEAKPEKRKRAGWRF